MSIKDVSIDYKAFGDDVDEELIREWIADEYPAGQVLAINTVEDGVVLTKGTRYEPEDQGCQ